MAPMEGKDSDSSDSRKTFINYSYILTFSVVYSDFFSLFPPSVVVVDFISTMKSI